MEMPRLYVLWGVQGSGKTTARNNSSTMKELPVVSSDDWFLIDEETGVRYWMEDGIRKYYVNGLNPKVLGEAWQWTWQRFGELLKTGQDFIFEGTFLTKQSRSPVINIAKAFGYKVVSVYFHVPLETALTQNRQRLEPIPDQVLARTFALIEDPTPEEGWSDELWGEQAHWI